MKTLWLTETIGTMSLCIPVVAEEGWGLRCWPILSNECSHHAHHNVELELAMQHFPSHQGRVAQREPRAGLH